MMAFWMEARMISFFLEVQVMMVMQMMSGQTKVQGNCCVSFHHSIVLIEFISAYQVSHLDCQIKTNERWNQITLFIMHPASF